ncbi:hypothetical protein QTH11_04115 [Clostridium perfringens]|uniref:hypothetical protein n=1 Tax=Clostridium perfringens TaxID=1502 RepID=UPI00016BD74A|nr:hypothetical protein [Clostridium perfringens]EDT27496.1 chorismate mutase [Clostridium perfringens CPE str. F4969]EGT2192686.1 hypothetical protein [Clostridium perfringens]EHA0993874.1 hypothetical protein [Clostridium perfringens]EHA1184223.1 hypothetical protein [Clostridium perfringens]EJT6142223.1 hypothetical protein [Clostridium perfringens]
MNDEKRKQELQEEIDLINNKIDELQERRAELSNELAKLNNEEVITAKDIFFFKSQKFNK